MRKIISIFAIAMMLSLPKTSFAQEDLRAQIAALRNEVSRLTEMCRTQQGRINELEENIAEINRKQANQDKQADQDAAKKLEELEKLVNKQYRDLSRQINTETANRQTAINNLIKTISKQISGNTSIGRTGGNTGGGRTPTIPPGFELKDYTIARGDTLSEIAKIAGTTVSKIKEINNLTSDSLRVGQKIKVPMKK